MWQDRRGRHGCRRRRAEGVWLEQQREEAAEHVGPYGRGNHQPVRRRGSERLRSGVRVSDPRGLDDLPDDVCDAECEREDAGNAGPDVHLQSGEGEREGRSDVFLRRGQPDDAGEDVRIGA